jgi:hypothetical protein
MKQSTKKVLIVGGAVAAVVGGVLWYKKAYPAVPVAQLQPGSFTPVATFTSGQKYTFAALAPSAIANQAALADALKAAGWINVEVKYFGGSGTVPAGFPRVADNGYIATGTWNGSSGTAVPNGVVAAATP